ncbi:unnamed protein product, partial [Thlaspi arvense]
KMAMEKAKEIVSSNGVVVFSKSYCPYCVRVKDLLKQLGAKFLVIELDKESFVHEPILKSKPNESHKLRSRSSQFHIVISLPLTNSMEDVVESTPSSNSPPPSSYPSSDPTQSFAPLPSFAMPTRIRPKKPNDSSCSPIPPPHHSKPNESHKLRSRSSQFHNTLHGLSCSLLLCNITGDGSKVQSALAEWTGQRTVPNVFIGGKHIGGCDTTMSMHSNGKLRCFLLQIRSIFAYYSSFANV